MSWDIRNGAAIERGSSPVDWCEGNYLISTNIAEFYNTFSNVLFFIFPPVLMKLFKDYGKYVHSGIHLVWVLLIVVGACSTYFHATLSLLGQLLDELAILWVYSATMCFFCPLRYLPLWLKNRKLLACLMLTFTIMATVLSVQFPVANAFVLMALAIPTNWMMYHELKRLQFIVPRVYNLGVRAAFVFFLAVFCWVNDRIFCDFYSSIKFTYLHAFWHILVFISSYSMCVLFAFFYVHDEHPHQNAELSYWPKDQFELGVPYISIRSKTLKEKI